jgi:hypothetical protein
MSSKVHKVTQEEQEVNGLDQVLACGEEIGLEVYLNICNQNLKELCYNFILASFPFYMG